MKVRLFQLFKFRNFVAKENLPCELSFYSQRFAYKLLLLLIVIAIRLLGTILIRIWPILVSSPEISVLLVSSSSSKAALVLISVALVHFSSSRLGLNVFLYQIDDFVGNAKVFDGASTNVAFVHAPEFVSILKYFVLSHL